MRLVLPGFAPSESVAGSRAYVRVVFAISALGLLVAVAGLTASVPGHVARADSHQGRSALVHIARLGWSFDYRPTFGRHADGTVFSNATFSGMPIFADFRVPFSFVDYAPGGEPFHDILDQFGSLNFDHRTPTFRGCPVSSVVRAADGVEGFLVNCQYIFDVPAYRWEEAPPGQRSAHCSLYWYEEQLFFYADGSFAPRVVAWGPGYNNPHTYNVALRLTLAPGFNYAFVRSRGGGWSPIRKESVSSARVARAWEVGTHRNSNSGLRVQVEPGSADDSEMWFLRVNNPADSSDGNGTLQTPAEFATPRQPLDGGQPVYLWYRGRAHNPGCQTIPFVLGPSLVRVTGLP